MTTVVNKPGQQLGSTSGKLLLSILGGFVLTRTAWGRCLLRWRGWWQAGGCHRSTSRRSGRIVVALSIVWVRRSNSLSENITDWGQAVACLRCRHVVNVRSA